MTSVMVFVKRNGLLVACRSERTQDGAAWFCVHCNAVLIRASFGVLNGVTHCACGSDVELVVDGRPIDVEELNVLPGRPPQPEELNDGSRKPLNDEDFLRDCGIATQGETENA